MGNICINDLYDYVILVDGKTKSCLYDLRNKKLYHINHKLSKLIQRVKDIPTTYLSLDEINIIQDLNNNGIDLSNIVTVEELRKSVSLSKNQIQFAWIEVCTTCNLRCIHCYNESSSMCKNEMSYDDFGIAVKVLKNMNVNKIQFIGGEPLVLGNKLKDMITYASDKFESIEVFTNGTLINDEWVQFFDKYNIKVALSVYSYIDSEHEKVTKVKGSYNKTKQAIEKLQKRNIKYRVCNTIMKDINIGDKNTDLFTLSTKKDIVRMSGRGNLNLLDEKLIKKKLITKDYFSHPLNKSVINSSLFFNNCFGSKIYIATDLTVYPCVMERRFSHGNMKENTNFKLDDAIMKLNKDKINGCKDCEFRLGCFDCRPDSLTGEICSKPWYCTYLPEIGEWELVENSLERIK